MTRKDEGAMKSGSAELLVVTDLDGTLLDHETYSFAAAEPALEALRARGIPVVMASSKTRAEIEYWRRKMGNGDPFIAENGGGVFLPRELFREAPEGTVERGGYWVKELGVRHEVLVEALREASRESGCRVRGFEEMTDEEVAERCGMPLKQARLARQREYDEPFVVVEEGREAALVAAIRKRKLGHTQGGRFHHILGDSDKARAVRWLVELYRSQGKGKRVVALGDSFNDVEMLREADVKVVIRSRRAEEVAAQAPGAMVTRQEGPAGWREAMEALLEEGWVGERTGG